MNISPYEVRLAFANMFAGMDGYAGILFRWQHKNRRPPYKDELGYRYQFAFWHLASDLAEMLWEDHGEMSLMRKIDKLNMQGYTVECTCATVSTQLNQPREKALFGKKADLYQTRTLTCDIDKVENLREAIEQLQCFNPCPSAMISSGGGIHCIWYLDQAQWLDSPEDIVNIESYREGLAEFLGADKGLRDASHKLRLPGTLNPKYDPPRLARFVYYEKSHVYPLSAFEMYRVYRPVETWEPDPSAVYERPSDHYVQAALDGCVRDVASARTFRNQALNGAAYRLGRFVGAELLDAGLVEQELLKAAYDNGLVKEDGKNQAVQTIRSGLKKGIADPFKTADLHSQARMMKGKKK